MTTSREKSSFRSIRARSVGLLSLLTDVAVRPWDADAVAVGTEIMTQAPAGAADPVGGPTP